jgi:uncharacterized protein (DUF849 family)
VHARDPRDGRRLGSRAFAAFLPGSRKSGAIINITTGGGLGMTVDDRLKAPALLRPEMCSLNMGSMNFGLFPLADRCQSWKYDWEEPYLRATEDFVFKNTFRDIAKILSVLGKEHGCRFEHECYDVGHLYNLAHIVDRKLITPPFFIQMIFGVLGGIGPDIANLMFMGADRGCLFGADYLWSVSRRTVQMPAQSVLPAGSVGSAWKTVVHGASWLARSTKTGHGTHDRRVWDTDRHAGRGARMAGAEGADGVAFDGTRSRGGGAVRFTLEGRDLTTFAKATMVAV